MFDRPRNQMRIPRRWFVGGVPAWLAFSTIPTTPLVPDGAKEVIFIRHGQSTANAAADARSGSHQDLLDAQLTSLGVVQSRSWAEIAPSWGVDKVLCSPLIRAMETTSNVFERTGAAVTVIPFARELQTRRRQIAPQN